MLSLYVADPANFLASNSVVGTLLSSENSLCIQLRGGGIVSTKILSLDFFA